MTQEEKIKAALELELSSNSSSSDEELEKLISQTSLKNKMAKSKTNQGTTK